MGRCSELRKTEKLKKIQLLLNQKNLYEDQFEELLAVTGDWKSNYTDYLITEPINFVESNRFVHEVEILRCNGELYIVCFKDNGVGLYFKAYHLLLTSWKTVKSISQAPEHKV